jgi:hypothetical protein
MKNLNPEDELQLKCATILSLSQNASVIDYETLQRETDIQTSKELEHILIHHCLYTGLLSARLDQKARQVHVYRAVPGPVSGDKFDRMIRGLSAWLDQAHRVVNFLDGMGFSLDDATEKALVSAQHKEAALERAKTQCDGDRDGRGAHPGEDDVPGKSEFREKKAGMKKPKRKKRQMDMAS